jgi:hypothetical protein
MTRSRLTLVSMFLVCRYWKEKDAALTLFLALGAKGKTRSQGATSVNELVPIDNFFQTQILPVLDCNGGKDINGGTTSPVLKADAIKFGKWRGGGCGGNGPSGAWV